VRLSRGAVVTASVGDPAGKPRPFVVLRSDHFAEHALVTLVAFSTTPNETPTLRVPVEPSAGNGLREASLAMIDRIVSVHRERIGAVIGQLADADLTAITHAVAVYLGIADPVYRARRRQRA
jgi:mRNA interferase MazF